MLTSVIRAASAGKPPGLPLTTHAAAAMRQVSSSLAGEAGAGEAPPPPGVRLQVRDGQGALHDYTVPRAVRSPPASGSPPQVRLLRPHTTAFQSLQAPLVLLWQAALRLEAAHGDSQLRLALTCRHKQHREASISDAVQGCNNSPRGHHHVWHR